MTISTETDKNVDRDSGATVSVNIDDVCSQNINSNCIVEQSINSNCIEIVERNSAVPNEVYTPTKIPLDRTHLRSYEYKPHAYPQPERRVQKQTSKELLDTWKLSLCVFYLSVWLLFVVSYHNLPKMDMRLGCVVIKDGSYQADYCFGDSKCTFETEPMVRLNSYDVYSTTGWFIGFNNRQTYIDYRFLTYDRDLNVTYNVLFSATHSFFVAMYGYFLIDIVYFWSMIVFMVGCIIIFLCFACMIFVEYITK